MPKTIVQRIISILSALQGNEEVMTTTQSAPKSTTEGETKHPALILENVLLDGIRCHTLSSDSFSLAKLTIHWEYFLFILTLLLYNYHVHIRKMIAVSCSASTT